MGRELTPIWRLHLAKFFRIAWLVIRPHWTGPPASVATLPASRRKQRNRTRPHSKANEAILYKWYKAKVATGNLSLNRLR